MNMKATDETTFVVTGYVGPDRAEKNYFRGFCIADSKGAALDLMVERIPMLNPTGANSLAELKGLVAALEKARDGIVPVPRQMR